MVMNLKVLTSLYRGAKKVYTGVKKIPSGVKGGIRRSFLHGMGTTRTYLIRINRKYMDLKRIKREEALLKLGGEVTSKDPFFNHIKIKPPKFQNLKQIKQFNKEILGIKSFDVKNQEMAEYLTNGFVAKFNQTNGHIFRRVKMVSNPKVKALMAYSEKDDTLYVYEEMVNELSKAAKDKGMTISQFMQQLGKMPLPGSLLNIPRGEYNYIFHELGHAFHYKQSSAAHKLRSYEELRASGIKDTTLLGEFYSTPKIKNIAAKVSDYSLKSPAEFVAETDALIRSGAKVPHDVEKLYNIYLRVGKDAKTIKPLLEGECSNVNRQILDEFFASIPSSASDFPTLSLKCWQV